ncbi:MAG: heme exporter protein CcmB [Bacteroidota bacterium]
MIKEIKTLIYKDLQLEWRQKYALNGMLLYVISSIYICYMSFRLKSNEINNITWNTLFWIIILFTAITSISKSFIQEREGRLLYYYTLVSAESVIISKIIYNSLILLVLSTLGFVFYLIIMGNPVQDIWMYYLSIASGSIGFASTLTLVASIASKSENSAMLMAILSFPIVIPLLLLILKITKNAMDGLDRSTSYDELLILTAIDAIVIVLSVILFPYLWRS